MTPFRIGLWATAIAFIAVGFAAPASAQPSRLIERDVVEAYHYMLARWLVLRQEARDLREGLRWNALVHRDPVPTTTPHPDLDLVQSDAWIAVDETSCTLLEVPEIKNRYFTVQVLNGWAEVTANINERRYSKQPFGRYALCLKDAKVTLPKGTRRVDLPNRKSRLVIRIELGDNPAEAVALQKKFVMRATGSPRIERAVIEPDFANDKLPGIDGFDRLEEVLASETDINRGIFGVQEKARAVAKALTDPAQRARFDDAIRRQAIPLFNAIAQRPGPAKNGWMHPRAFGTFGSDYQIRSVVNFTNLWANSSSEMVAFSGTGFDGSLTYTMTFPADALPESKTKHLWSVTAMDADQLRVMPNALNRHTLNKRSALQFADDGSLTLAFGPRAPQGLPESNWLPTAEGKRYNLTFRFYAPTRDVGTGKYYPPPLVRRP